MVHLDTFVLRTFVAAADLGGLAHAAQQVGRSQGAVSMQIQKLEDQLGQPLFIRGKQGVALTEAGERLLHHARKMLDLNDAAVGDIQGYDVAGSVRFGMPQDFAESVLPNLLGRFVRTHPSVHLVAQVDRNQELALAVGADRLDLALTFGAEGKEAAHTRAIARFPSVWIGNSDCPGGFGDPILLVAFEKPCIFRSAAEAALQSQGRHHRIAMTSPSLPGLWAGTAAGLGVTVRTPLGVPESLRILGPETGLPALPPVVLYLHRSRAGKNKAADRFEALLSEALSAKPWSL